MSVKVQKGAVKYNSIMDMARTISVKTNEPVKRVYIRIYMRMKKLNMTPSEAFHVEKRTYTMKEVEQVQV